MAPRAGPRQGGVDVIRHQRIGVERDLVGPGQLTEAHEQQPEVVRRREELAVVAPADHVDGTTRCLEPGEARHGDAARRSVEVGRERVPRRSSSRLPSLART